MQTTLDILGLGCSAIDDLFFVPDYPPADSKVQVRRHERHCGGLTATALVAAARLGSRCAFAGVLSEDELSRFVLERLTQEGIDTSHVYRNPAAGPVHAVIIVDETHKTRTIFFELPTVFSGQSTGFSNQSAGFPNRSTGFSNQPTGRQRLPSPTCGRGAEGEGFQPPEHDTALQSPPQESRPEQPDWPAEEVIRSSRVLFVDHLGVDRMIRAGRVARQAGVPVVADLESDEHPRFPELLALVDHLIVSQDFAKRLTGQGDPAVAAEQLWTASRQAVVVTCGREGCWYRGAAERAVHHQPAFAVTVVDTTGCGDVFHGAYASALARGLDLPARVRLASAAAALKATQPGGQAGIPSRPAVEAFLAEHPEA